MTPFVMDKESEDRLHALAQYATQHPFRLAEMQAKADAYARGETIETPSEEFQAQLPFGFKVVFTVEEHPLKNGSGPSLLRHMSMSAPRQGRVPHQLAAEWVMGQLGYTSSFEQCMVYPEEFGPDRVAINVLEVVKTTETIGHV